MSKNIINQSLETSLNRYVDAAKRDLISACANALKAGACICAMANQAKVSVGSAIGMLETGVSRSTLYRWANAYDTAIKKLGLDHIPVSGTPGWENHLNELEQLAHGTSISRLLLGAPAGNSDIARLDTIQTGVETADNETEEAIYNNALERVEKGEWTLIQAMRAIGSQSAQNVATERRKDPVYISIDEETKKPVGILPKAISSLKTGFDNRDAFDGESRRVIGRLWNDVLHSLPPDFNKYI